MSCFIEFGSTPQGWHDSTQITIAAIFAKALVTTIPVIGTYFPRWNTASRSVLHHTTIAWLFFTYMSPLCWFCHVNLIAEMLHQKFSGCTCGIIPGP